MEDSTPEDSPPFGIDPAVSRLIFVAMLGLGAGGFVAFRMLSKPVEPPPPEVAKDPLLTQGRTIYLVRCADLPWQRRPRRRPDRQGLTRPTRGQPHRQRVEAR